MTARRLPELFLVFLRLGLTSFGGPVALKLSAQAAPVVGAAGGAAVNIAFLEHFRSIAEGHFTVRRLERLHGAVAVRAAYQDLATQRDARFMG